MVEVLSVSDIVDKGRMTGWPANGHARDSLDVLDTKRSAMPASRSFSSARAASGVATSPT